MAPRPSFQPRSPSLLLFSLHCSASAPCGLSARTRGGMVARKEEVES